MTDPLECDECGEVSLEEAIRRKPMADLDPMKWQNFCCPDCGRRIKTAFVPLLEGRFDD